MTVALTILVVILALVSCSQNSKLSLGIKKTEVPPAVTAEPDEIVETENDIIEDEIGVENMTNPIVTFTLENGMVINIELYPDKAPNSVNNFISLVNKGYYDGLIFHRIIDGFMIQGGDPTGTGGGGPGYSIPGEFSQNGFAQNDVKHVAGVLSMARSQSPDSGGSQFFLMVAPSPHLDGAYAAFGKVADEKSLQNCLELGKAATGANDRPLNPPTIKTATVDTKGVEYEEPKHS